MSVAPTGMVPEGRALFSKEEHLNFQVSPVFMSVGQFIAFGMQAGGRKPGAEISLAHCMQLGAEPEAHVGIKALHAHLPCSESSLASKALSVPLQGTQCHENLPSLPHLGLVLLWCSLLDSGFLCHSTDKSPSSTTGIVLKQTPYLCSLFH